jgi:hypothetical protein
MRDFTSVGWIVRDKLGSFVMAGTTWNHGKCSEGETIALLETMNYESNGATRNYTC